MPPAAEPTSPASPVAPPGPSKKPEDTPFKQQRLPAWQPIMSPKWVIGCFLILGPLFIGVGVAIVLASDSVVEIEVRYDHKQPCPWSARSTGPSYRCTPFTSQFTVPKVMQQPVFMYYKLENFYQNHRLYAKSVSDSQLSGGSPGADPSDCSPRKTVGETVNLNQNSWTNIVRYLATGGQPTAGITATDVNLNNVMYNPCGLIAWSQFNDTFKLTKPTGPDAGLICDGGAFDVLGNPTPGVLQKCVKRGIAWPSDPGVRFAAPLDQGSQTLTYRGWEVEPSTDGSPWASHVQNGWYVGEPGHKIPNPQDEDFMVWMRLASLSSFRKLYRKITVDLQPGAYELEVAEAFDVSSFKGKKSFVLSTSSWIGGKNYFLAGMYIAVGSLCLILGAAFFFKFWTTPRRIGAI